MTGKGRGGRQNARGKSQRTSTSRGPKKTLDFDDEPFVNGNKPDTLARTDRSVNSGNSQLKMTNGENDMSGMSVFHDRNVNSEDVKSRPRSKDDNRIDVENNSNMDTVVNSGSSAPKTLTNDDNNVSINENITNMTIDGTKPKQVTNSGYGNEIDKNANRVVTAYGSNAKGLDDKTQKVGDQNTENGSRFQSLANTCKHCDKVCVEVPGLFSENIVCTTCKQWSQWLVNR